MAYVLMWLNCDEPCDVKVCDSLDAAKTLAFSDSYSVNVDGPPVSAEAVWENVNENTLMARRPGDNGPTFIVEVL